jgi:hypothetical protein
MIDRRVHTPRLLWVQQPTFGTARRDARHNMSEIRANRYEPPTKRIKTNSRGKKPAKLGGSHGPLIGPCLFAAEPRGPV